jgi:hypothetical protein
LAPPQARGGLTIVEVHRAQGPEEHSERVRAWARSVWEAYRPHHEWARAQAGSGVFTESGTASN